MRAFCESHRICLFLVGVKGIGYVEDRILYYHLTTFESTVLGTWLLAVSKLGPVSATTELIVQLFLFSTHSLPYFLVEL